VNQKHKLADRRPDGAWTRPDAYVEAMARKRSFRRAHKEPQRTQPEIPRLLLSTVPFVALFGLLAVLVVAIAVTAFPGTQPRPKEKAVAAAERGTAQRGWFEEAQKDMHR
jgi:hypothetical protein